MNDNELTLFDKAIIAVVPITLLLSVILFIVTGNQNAEIKSLVLGAITSMVLNYGNYKLVFKVQQTNYRKLKLFTVLSYTIRFLVLGILTAVACIFSDYNVIYILFGIAEYPIFLIVFGLLDGKGGKRKID